MTTTEEAARVLAEHRISILGGGFYWCESQRCSWRGSDEESVRLHQVAALAAAGLLREDPAPEADEDDPIARDRLAAVEAGDPDPTDMADNRCDLHWDRWYCTRDADHPGQHIAGDGYDVLAVLPGASS